jgi:hypothetical protein
MLLDPTRNRPITDRIASRVLYVFTVSNGVGDFLDLYIDFYYRPARLGIRMCGKEHPAASNAP